MVRVCTKVSCRFHLPAGRRQVQREKERREGVTGSSSVSAASINNI